MVNRWWLDAWDSIGSDWTSKMAFSLLWLTYAAVGAALGLLIGWVVGAPGLGAAAGVCVGALVAGAWLAVVLARRPRDGRPLSG
jgi:hypothetical protein